jgi:TolB-like protein/tetratricopeptide (TPR) repeat protein
MYTDMVGYTALGQRNESLSLALVEEQRKLIRPILARHNGREIKTMGDAFLVEFPNATDSVRCAYDIQRATKEFNLALVSDKRIHLEIGIHLGEVVESQGDISGDAVNVASRIYPLAEDGGVCLTRQVYDHVLNKTELQMTSIGMKPLKNVNAAIEVFKMEMPWEQPAPSKEAVVLPRDRIAILPFANMSPDPNDEYFADSITDEIITTVSGISGLSVISRTSAMVYKGASKKLGEIGRELGVGSILEGSFKKAGNRIRVTTQLIDVVADKHLWAQNYDRNLDDVFEVQSDVAKQVAEALRVKILTSERERIEKKPTESTVAYTLYLRGRSIWNRRGLENILRANEYFELAVKEDPGFALGYSGQADCAIMLPERDIDQEENLAKARVMAERALQLDPALAEAHATLGLVHFDEYDLRGAEEEFKKAIEQKPSYATAHQWYSMLLRTELRWDEALKEIEKAAELDPLSGVIMLNFGAHYIYRRDFGMAAQKYRVAVDLGFEAHGNLMYVYGLMKMFDQMEKEAEARYLQMERDARYLKDLHLRDVMPDNKTYIDVWRAYLTGDKETVRRLLPKYETLPKEAFGDMSAAAIGSLYFFLGDANKGFEWLERAYYKREEDLLYIQLDLGLDAVRTDPRYLDLVKRLGLDQAAQSIS